MRRALTQLLPEGHRLIEKQSCKRRDSNEPPNCQNVSFSSSSATFFFDWSQSHCFSLNVLPGALRTFAYHEKENRVPHFKISFESRRCYSGLEHVAKGSTVREKRAPSYVQSKLEQFDQVERLQRPRLDLPHSSRSFVVC